MDPDKAREHSPESIGILCITDLQPRQPFFNEVVLSRLKSRSLIKCSDMEMRWRHFRQGLASLFEPRSDPFCLRVEKTLRNSANLQRDAFLRFALSAKLPGPAGICRHRKIVGK
jgi:hypothetical protein